VAFSHFVIGKQYGGGKKGMLKHENDKMKNSLFFKREENVAKKKVTYLNLWKNESHSFCNKL